MFEDQEHPDEDHEMNEYDREMAEYVRFTIPSEPPASERRQRRSWWADVFAEARQFPGEWRLVVEAFAESTARQIASDIRNAHKRQPDKMRLRGILPGEMWDARCAPALRMCSDEPPVKEPYWVWILNDGPV